MSPVFEDAPLKLKPMTENVARTSGSFAMICSACLEMFAVNSSEAPAGACPWTRKYPGSSSGTNDCGTSRSNYYDIPSVQMNTATTDHSQAMPRRSSRTYALKMPETTHSKNVKKRHLWW